jgi:hypothetical protein
MPEAESSGSGGAGRVIPPRNQPRFGLKSTTVTNHFFDTVQAKIALVPSPASLWGSERSRRIREYFNDKNIRVYVSGIEGDVSLLICKDKYEIIKSE